MSSHATQHTVRMMGVVERWIGHCRFSGDSSNSDLKRFTSEVAWKRKAAMAYISAIEETALHTKDSAQSESESVAARWHAAYAMALTWSLLQEQEVVSSLDSPARASNALFGKLWLRVVGS